MVDHLAQYRKKPLETSSAKPKAAEEYAACGGKDKIERLRIRRALAPTRSPRYMHLQDMAYDGEFGTNFVLVYDFMIVLVQGKNLQGIITAIENGTADFIQEYHPDLWEKPADDVAVIDSIQVIIKGADDPELADQTAH